MSEQNRKVKNVSVGEIVVTANPHILASHGLGSCVAVAMYDLTNGVGGMAHVMLPDSKGAPAGKLPGKFADTSIPYMLEKMKALGASEGDIRCKLVGGSQMFTIPGARRYGESGNTDKPRNIGERNLEALRRELRKRGVVVIAEDTGGDYGRSMRFDPKTGEIWVRSMHTEENRL